MLCISATTYKQDLVLACFTAQAACRTIIAHIDWRINAAFVCAMFYVGFDGWLPACRPFSLAKGRAQSNNALTLGGSALICWGTVATSHLVSKFVVSATLSTMQAIFLVFVMVLINAGSEPVSSGLSSLIKYVIEVTTHI